MSIPKKIDDEALYKIRVKRVVRHGVAVLRPTSPDIRVKGRVLAQIRDDVIEATQVTPAVV